MIFPQLTTIHKLMLIGCYEFSGIKPPKDLKTSLINFPENDDNCVEFAIANNVSAILAIPQPNVSKVCESHWLKSLSQKFPVCLMWYDYTIYSEWVHKLNNCFHIILDNQKIRGPNIIPVWTPININFVSPQEKREINVAFYGKIDCEQRLSALKFLLNKGIPVFTAGNDWNIVSYETMYNFMKTSKIILNFSNTRFHPHQNTHQLKGRVMEAMLSGAMVIENENDQSSIYFHPGKDLVWFKTHDELAEKIKYYMHNDKERTQIASNGQYLCRTKYSMDNWWRSFLPELIKFKVVKI